MPNYLEMKNKIEDILIKLKFEKYREFAARIHAHCIIDLNTPFVSPKMVNKHQIFLYSKT